MRHALLIYTDETAGISSDERSRRAATFTSFQDQMHARGVVLASERLHPTERRQLGGPGRAATS